MDSTRRKFLLQSAALTGSGLLASQIPPVEKIIKLILNDTFRQAQAGSQYVSSQYCLITLVGAPPRWSFDQFFKTQPGESISTSPMVATNFVSNNGSYTSAAYEVVGYKTLLVPKIWGTQVPNGAGAMRPMRDLLDHMIVFRGYGSGTDGHPSNGCRQTDPIPGAGSVSGHMADHSSTLFKAVQYPILGSQSGYSSIQGTGLTTLNRMGVANYASALLSPFGGRSETPNISKLRSRYPDLINQSQNILRGLASGDHTDFQPISVDQQQAIQKIKDGIADVDQSWNALYTKYHNIAFNTFVDRTAPGFNDQPVVTGTNKDQWIVRWNGVPYYPTPGQDMRDWVRAVDITPIANSFALAEFVLTRGLSSAFETGIDQPGNIQGSSNQQLGMAAHDDTPINIGLEFDQHNTGVNSGLYLNSCLYRSLAACLLELTDQLKSAGLFDSTVIHLTQEFGRAPRRDGSGADHLFDGMISSVITGQQTTGPIVVGNILAEGTGGVYDGNYTGCMGYKTPTNVSGNNILLTPAHVTSSLAVLLGLPTNPWGNNSPPLVQVSSSGVTATAEAKVVS